MAGTWKMFEVHEGGPGYKYLTMGVSDEHAILWGGPYGLFQVVKAISRDIFDGWTNVAEDDVEFHTIDEANAILSDAQGRPNLWRLYYRQDADERMLVWTSSSFQQVYTRARVLIRDQFFEQVKHNVLESEHFRIRRIL